MRKKQLLRVVFTIIMVLIFYMFSPFASDSSEKSFTTDKGFYRVKITEIDENNMITAKILNGKYKDKSVILENRLSKADDPVLLKKSDKLLIFINDNDPNNITATIYQYIRDKSIAYLVLFFCLAVVIIAGMKGVCAIASIMFTVSVIMFIMLPNLVSGKNPILMTIIASLLIASFSLFIQNGINKKSFSALIGTLGGVVISGIVVAVMSHNLQISVNNEEFMHLSQIGMNIKYNYQQLLFCGIVIGSLGANIDMSMSVATSMNEIKKSNPGIKKSELFFSGMNVGKDVISTMCNTLILAYVGSSLISLMIFMGNNIDLLFIVNMPDILREVLKSMAGAIGILLSVPLTVATRIFIE